MTKAQAFSIGALVLVSITGCGQLGNVQTPRNEFVTGVDIDGNPTVLRTAETRAIIDLYAGREAIFPAGTKPRIVLRPTPGKEQLIPRSIAGFFPNEVLMSRESGGYFAFLSQVPVTRYFRVLGASDCDNAIWRQMTNTDLIKRFNQSYLGSGPRGASYTWNCLAVVDYHWRQSNFSYKDSDGVIFDPDTAETLDEADKPFLGINFLQRVKMSGWAIKFVDPEPVDFEAFLSDTRINSWSEVQQKQWQAILFFIEQNQTADYAKRLVPLLPTNSRHSWREIDRRMLHTVAKVAPEALDDQLLLGLLAFGVDGDIYSRIGYMVDPVAHASAQNVPFVAANVLACRKSPRANEELKFIARNARFYNHRNAAVNALTYQGDTSIIEDMKRSRDVKVNVDARWLFHPQLAHPYKCPYGASS
jgi:hypothetical protein